MQEASGRHTKIIVTELFINTSINSYSSSSLKENLGIVRFQKIEKILTKKVKKKQNLAATQNGKNNPPSINKAQLLNINDVASALE